MPSDRSWWGWENADSSARTEAVLKAIHGIDTWWNSSVLDMACGSAELIARIAVTFPNLTAHAIDIRTHPQWVTLQSVRPWLISIQEFIAFDQQFDLVMMLNSYRNWTGTRDEKMALDNWIGRNVRYFLTSDAGNNNLPWAKKVIGTDFKGHEMVLYTVA